MGGLAAVAAFPVRQLGPTRSSCHQLSSASCYLGRASSSSLLLFLHRRKFPVLHLKKTTEHCSSLRVCATSVTELDGEESSPVKPEKWKRQTPKPREKFSYPQRGQNSNLDFPWRSANDEPSSDKGSSNNYRQKRSYTSAPSNLKQDKLQEPRARNFAQQRPLEGRSPTRFNTDVPWDTQRRSFDSSRDDDQATSTSRGRDGETARAGGRYTAKSTTSRNSQYDTGRNMHRAPWEQGPPRAGRAVYMDTRPPVPVDRDFEDDKVMEDFEADVTYDKDIEFGMNDPPYRTEKTAMARIVEKLRNIQNNNNAATRPETESNKKLLATDTSAFLPRPGVPVRPGLDRRWSNADHPAPKRVGQASSDPWQLKKDASFPWEKNEDEMDQEEEPVEKKKKVKPPSMAELTIPQDELKRLRGLGLMVRQRLKIGRQGVTPGIVEAIHNGWRTCEIVKVKCDGPPALNMKRTHEELESLTGGLVIWRSGSAAVIYRGKDYVPPSLRQMQERVEAERMKLMSLDLYEDDEEEVKEGETSDSGDNDLGGSASPNLVGDEKSPAQLKKEQELQMVEEILEGLGPRYADWTGQRPVPVDGDLLLSPDFEFKRPFRLLPYGVKPKLNNFELTELRHLARPIPPHFVLGRNKGLSGLAAAIVKLWEKSEIVKLGVKRGVQNTNNERMAEELKRLTGGVLIARDKEFIVLFRGKDFLPPAVQAVLEERDRMARALQEEEERVRMGGRSKVVQLANVQSESSKVGTLEEALQAKAAWESWQSSEGHRKERIAARKAARFQATQKIERKVMLAAQKKLKAQDELAKLDSKMRLAGAPIDREHLSDEERYMFQKLGLRMKAYLLLGRRGVFDGTVENMHLHWKHRELVKILVKAPLDEVEQTARMLEIESGGILVGIVTTSKGQAVIVYRGKNYQRPPELRPKNLLTKRQALKRSLEVQRMRSLEKHIEKLEEEIEKMQVGLKKMESADEDLEDEDSGGSFDDIDDAELGLDTYNDEYSGDEPPLFKGDQPKNKLKLDPIFRAEPLTRKERSGLRQQTLKLGKPAHFNIGKNNVEEGVTKSIRLYFQKHAFVKVGVKGRPRGTTVAEIVEAIEEATGGTLISTEPSKLIFYRGWPAGEERPDMSTDEEGDRALHKEGQDSMAVNNLIKESSASIEQSNMNDKEDEGAEDGEDDGLVDDDDMGIDAWDEEEFDEDEPENEGELDGDETQWLEFDESDSEHCEPDNLALEKVNVAAAHTDQSNSGQNER